jgi:hypothetical protein
MRFVLRAFPSVDQFMARRLYLVLLARYIACCLLASTALAGNVDLSTVPSRDAVQLTIYNSEDLTLVRDLRKITFKKGDNTVQFSWANTQIDPTSVQLKFVTSADKLDVLDTTFPHDKPQLLRWNVKSEFDGEATVEISYFTSGISWTADYLCVADKDEKTLSLEGFVRVTNHSGEEYENAQVRLVVGTINLVEKIAQLAGVPVERLGVLAEGTRLDLKRNAAENFLGRGGMEWAEIPADAAKKEKEIIKEGLSEYFIYTIEGTENIPNGWSKRLRSFEGQDAEFKIEYRYRPAEYGEQLVRMYVLRNDEESKLGITPLPDGTVRVFRDNGRDGLSYLTQQQIKYVPIGDKIELNLGPDPEVIFELIKLRSYRDNFWLQINGTTKYRKVGGDEIAKVENATVAGWDEYEVYVQRIRNYTSKPVNVEVRRSFPGHVVFRSKLEPTLHDFQTPEFHANVEAREKKDLLFKTIRSQGYLAKQNNVTLAATPGD